MRTEETSNALELQFDESNDEFCDRETQEYPDYVRQFAEKQDKKSKAEKVFAAKVIAFMAVAIAVLFYVCWIIYK